MAIIPLLRLIIFCLITVFSLVVLGLCSYFASLIVGVNAYTSFVPLGIAAACLSLISLPLFWFLGTRPTRVFTSMILFEIIWFFLLWLLWVATAGSAVGETALACGTTVDAYGDPVGNSSSPICAELAVVEAFAFLSFFCAFIYYDVIFLYAIINAIRGRGVWTMSVKDAAAGGIIAPTTVMPMSQPPYPATAQYGAYPPPNQPYNAYPQQAPPPFPPAQPYNPQAPPQGAPDAQYNAYPPQQAPNQPYNYPPAPGTPQQQASYPGYNTSPTGNNTTLPPQPNYGAHPVHGSQAPLPLPSGYQV